MHASRNARIGVMLVIVGAVLLWMLWSRDRGPASPVAAPPTSTEIASREPLSEELADHDRIETEPSVPTDEPEPAEPVPTALAGAPTSTPRSAALPAIVRIHAVTADGRPFAEALGKRANAPSWPPRVLATVRPVEGPFAASIPLSARAGTYRARAERSDLPWSCIGEMELDRDPPVFLSLLGQRELLASQELLVFQDEVTFVLDPDEFLRRRSGLRLRVVDGSSSAPIDDAKVSLQSSDLGYAFATMSTSRANGSFEASELPPGPWRLRIDKAGFGPVDREIVLPIGEVLELEDVDLDTAVPIRVRVTGAATPEAVHVYYEPLASLRTGQHVMMRDAAPQNAQGEFEVTPGDGDGVVWAMETKDPPKQSAYALVRDHDFGAVVELELVAHVMLTLTSSRPATGRTIEIRDALDIPVVPPRELEASPFQWYLVPGRYRVLLNEPDGQQLERWIDLDATRLEHSLD